MRVLSDVPVSRNWYKTVSNLYKIGICQILYKNSRIKQIIFSKYATNLKTTISQRSLSYLGLLLPMADQYTGHVIETETRDNHNSLPLVGGLVTWYRRINNYTYNYVLCLSIKSFKNEKSLNSNNNRSKSKLLRLLWDIVVFRLVAYLLNMICLNLLF